MSSAIAIPEILPDVAGQIREAISKEIKQYPVNSNWASSLGHPCARFGVHRRRDWQTKDPVSPELQMIFNGGKIIEKYIAKDYLEKAGYTIAENNRPIQNEKSGMLKRLEVAGYLDFVCRDDNTKFEFPVEVKSMAPYVWEKTNTIEDLLFSKKTWHKTYPGQLTLYLLGKDYEVGMFLLINKLTYAPKVIWVHLDYTYAEELAKRAEEINRHMAAGTYPDRIPYDDNVCGKCDFGKICLENYVRTEAQILTDEDLVAKLQERESLKEPKKRYEELDEEVKVQLHGIKKGVAGDFAIIGKEVSRKGYTVEEKSYWQTSIKKL